MANTPSFNCNNITVGPGIFYIGAVGTTPSTDIGAISEDGMEIAVTQEFLDVYQGNPKARVCRFKTSEEMEITATGIEWDLLNLPIALGSGVTTSSATLDTYAYGGDPNSSEAAISIQHALPAGDTISIYVWRAAVLGDWTLTMAQDELHTFPFSFVGLVATQNWGGETLAVGQQLFRIHREKVT